MTRAASVLLFMIDTDLVSLSSSSFYLTRFRLGLHSLVDTRGVPGTVFGNGTRTLMQYFVLPNNGSKY